MQATPESTCYFYVNYNIYFTFQSIKKYPNECFYKNLLNYCFLIMNNLFSFFEILTVILNCKQIFNQIMYFIVVLDGQFIVCTRPLEK